MKLKNKDRSRLRMTMSALFVFMLLFYTFIPYTGAKAAGEIRINPVTQVNGSNSIVTEKSINGSDTIQLNLTLDNNLDWAHDFASERKDQLVINSMEADIDNSDWNTYKTGNVLASVSSDNKTLTIKLKNDAAYNITNNQTVSMNLSAALIENWEGTVAPVSFTIYAQPKITMGGSIMNNTTKGDLIKGGKTIDFNLVNATWDQTKITQLGGLNQILDQFYCGTDRWYVAQYLKLVDPNNYVSFENENKTLRLTLPAIPDSKITQGNITFQPNETTDKLSGTYNIDSVGGDIGILDETGALGFSIDTTDTPTLSVTTSMTEQTITSGSASKLIIELNPASTVTWDLATVDKKNALIDALVAADQADQWDKIKNTLKNNPTKVVIDSSKKKLTITIPMVAGYYLTKDQSISLTVPYQVLSDNVNLGKKTFTVNATPKVLISGTATPTVSQSDISKGGKTLIVTLVNATWANDIATNTIKREKLLSGFKWINSDPNFSDPTPKLNAQAQVVRTNNQVVTITLPPIDGFKIPKDMSIDFNPTTISTYISTVQGTFSKAIINNAVTIKPIGNQTATVTGMTNTNQFDIASGGKTITITLKNDTWVKNVETNSNKITISDDQGNTLSYSQINRTSDTAVTLTLDPKNLNITKDATVDILIPNQLVNTSSTDIKVKSAFKILAVTANLSVTGITLAPADIQKGGKTITVKLNNATFNNYTDPNFKTNFINCFSSTGTNWGILKTAILSDLTKIKATKDTVTFTLPPVPNYQSVSSETISLTIAQSLIINANRGIPADKSITIGQVATAQLNPTSLSESDIQNGATISITLTGANWDPTLKTNKSKLSTLIKGFSTTDQIKEWTLVSSAFQSSTTQVTISSDKKTLFLAIPALSNYSIIRDQKIDVTIPKSVLENYNYDISAEQMKINVPVVKADQSFSNLLNDDFAKYIEDNGINNIRVIVPEKKVNTITVNTVDFPGSSSITTIEATTTSDVKKMKVTIKGKNGEVTKEQNGAGNFKFVFSNLEKNSDLIVSVYGNSSSDPLQQDIYAKIPGSSITYNEVPKTSLAGSYSLYRFITDKSLVSNIFKYYSTNDLKIGKK
ncbi:hypothetical protein [Neobacillus niacini]|uniref:hypothetical protein n=1 Tax=Neobacillus niacini TaxID=86668 RepID=UPI00285730A2|nr:hypothetical protein [Neobacillus niacini]MDR7000988.1 uncharacterized protein YqfB (UPF0267 family) [Neobacillus niacini]